MNENQNRPQSTSKTFAVIDGNTLMAQGLPPLQFSVEKMLGNGLFIPEKSDKIGKPRLSPDMCVNATTDDELWKFPCEQGDVSYLALGDNDRRLQGGTHIQQGFRHGWCAAETFRRHLWRNDGLPELSYNLSATAHSFRPFPY